MSCSSSKLQFRRICRSTAALVIATILCMPATGFSQDTVKVAFTADQGVGEFSRSVLALVRDEGADLLMLQGDFGYDANTAHIWASELDEILGEDFPVLGVAGNHENFEWPLYKRFLQKKLDNLDTLDCDGDTGVKAICQFGLLDIVQVSPGIYEVEGIAARDNYAQYLTDNLSVSDKPWRICAWHKNQSNMQVGKKNDSVGAELYEACREQGAIIATGHDHTYSRTFLLDDMLNPNVVHRESEMIIEPGASISFVSGLGGQNIRPQQRHDDWWASAYTSTQNASHGALFCEFGPTKAECYFKDVSGAVPDIFTLVSGHAVNNSDALNTAVVNVDTTAGFQSNSANNSDALDEEALALLNAAGRGFLINSINGEFTGTPVNGAGLIDFQLTHNANDVDVLDGTAIANRIPNVHIAEVSPDLHENAQVAEQGNGSSLPSSLRNNPIFAGSPGFAFFGLCFVYGFCAAKKRD